MGCSECGFYEKRGISWPAEDLLASQEVLCSMDFQEGFSFFVFAPCISSIKKTLFIVPNDAHYYKIIEILTQFKIIILAPICFGSRRNHTPP